MNIHVSNIRMMLLQGQEELVKGCINTFSCGIQHTDGSIISLNPGIEHFLQNNAIQFAKMKTAITYFSLMTMTVLYSAILL